MKALSLATEKVYPNPEQPRKLFDAAALEELAASIKANGLLQPIRVRADGKGRYMIVAGERRWRAHALAGIAEVRAEVVEASDDDVAISAIVENLQRQDITPLEEAYAFQRMLDAGYTAEGLAQRLGLKQPHRVTDRTQLLRLEPEYLDLFKKGHLTPSMATELSRLDKGGQAALFAMIKEGRCDTYARLRAAADGILAAAAQAAMFDLPPPPTAAEIATLTKFERMVEKLVSVCAAGIKDNEVVVLRKINPDRAKIIVQQLGLIRDDLSRMEKALQFSAAQASLMEGETT